MNTMKTKNFVLGLFLLLGIMLPAQYATAGEDQKHPNRNDMATTAMRGTYMFSTGNIDMPELIFAKTFVRHEQQYLTPEAKLEDISKLIESQRKTYKVENIQTEPIDVIVDVEKNRVAVRWSADVDRLPTADNKEAPEHMKFEGVTISKFENGKLAEQWVYYDANLVLTLTRLNFKDQMIKSAPAKNE